MNVEQLYINMSTENRKQKKTGKDILKIKKQ